MKKKFTPLDKQRAEVLMFANNMYALYLFNKLIQDALEVDAELEKQDLEIADKIRKQQMNDLSWQLLLSQEILSTLPCVGEA